jgi:hypothetical protein
MDDRSFLTQDEQIRVLDFAMFLQILININCGLPSGQGVQITPARATEHTQSYPWQRAIKTFQTLRARSTNLDTAIRGRGSRANATNR